VSALTVKCPSGHRNQTTQKFCGQCGVALAGVCPNGHENPPTQRYCGECGANIPETTPVETLSSRVYLDVDPAQESPEPASPEPATEARTGQPANVASIPTASRAGSVGDSSATTWYNRQTPTRQFWINLALLTPVLILYIVQYVMLYPALDRAGRHVANGFVTVLYGLYFVAVIGWVARDRQTRRWALAVAACAAFLDIIFSWPVDLDYWPAFWTFATILAVYVAAWGLARRQHRTWWWGLVLAAILCTAYRYFVSGTDQTGWERLWFRYPIAFVIGCLTCWAVDYGNRLSTATKNHQAGWG